MSYANGTDGVFDGRLRQDLESNPESLAGASPICDDPLPDQRQQQTKLLKDRALKVIDDRQRLKPNDTGDDEWTYIAFTYPLVSFAKQGKLDQFRNSPLTFKPASASVNHRPGALDLWQAAVDCWGDAKRPDAKHFDGMYTTDILPPFGDYLQRQREATLYLQRLVDSLLQFCISEISRLPKDILRGLELLCTACVAEDHLPRLLLLNFAGQGDLFRDMEPPEAWASLMRGVKRHGLPEVLVVFKFPESDAQLLKRHKEDTKLMTAPVGWIKRAALSLEKPALHLAEKATAILAAFFTEGSHVSQLNSRWVFNTGKAHLARIFTLQNSGGNSATNVFVFQLLIRHISQIKLDIDCAPYFVRRGVHKVLIRCCLAFSFSKNYTPPEEQDFLDSMAALVMFTGACPRGFECGIEENMRLLNHLWTDILAATKEIADRSSFAGGSLKASWRPPVDKNDYEIGTQGVRLLFGLTRNLRLLCSTAPERRMMGSAFEINVNMIQILQRISLLGANLRELLLGDEAQIVFCLLCDLIMAATDGIYFGTLAYSHAFVLVMHLYPHLPLPRKPQLHAQYITQQMTQELKSQREALHLFFNSELRPIPGMWNYVGTMLFAPESRWWMLELLANVATELVHPKRYLPPKQEIKRGEMILELRKHLVAFYTAFQTEEVAGRPMTDWVELADLLKPVNLAGRIIVVMYNPRDEVVPTASDAEKDKLLKYLRPWVDLEPPSQASRMNVPDAEMSVFSNVKRLSCAVLTLISDDRATNPLPSNELTRTVARKSPETAAVARAAITAIQQVDAVVSERQVTAADTRTIQTAFALGRMTVMRLATVAGAVLLPDVNRSNLSERCGQWMDLLPAFKHLPECLKRNMTLDGEEEITKWDMTHITDFAAKHSDAILKCQKLVPARLWLLLTCLYPFLLDWDSAPDKASVPVVLKSLLEAHIALCQGTPKPEWWKDKCKQSWLAVRKARLKLKLSRAVTGQLDTLLQMLNGIGKQPEVQQVAVHEQAMQELLEEEEREQRMAAKKAKKKQSKQAARKKKAETLNVAAEPLATAENRAEPGVNGRTDPAASAQTASPQKFSPVATHDSKGLQPEICSRSTNPGSQNPPDVNGQPSEGAKRVSSATNASVVPNPRKAFQSPETIARNNANKTVTSLAAMHLGPDVRQQLEDLYTCPITQEVLQDPVAATDGFTYERTAIEAWVRKSGNSPMTKAPLRLEDLHPNLLVKQMIAALLQK